MKRRILQCLLLAACLGAALAHADPIGDLQSGTNLFFADAQATLDGSTFTAGEWVIPKAAGTLNVSVPLTYFGISHPDSIRMTGARNAAGDLVWTFDQDLSPELVSGSTHVQHVQGQIVAHVQWLSGAAAPTCAGTACAWNVLLTPAPGSEIHVHGCQDFGACWGFDKDILVRTFRAFGGLPRPALSAVALDLPGSRCASSSTTYAGGVVTVGSPAPSTGALVDLRSTDPAHVQVRPVWVPSGLRTQRFTVAISAGWSGTAQMVASAGGAVRMATVDRVPCAILKLPYVLRQVWFKGRPWGLLADGRILVHGDQSDTLFDPDTQKTEDLSALLKLDDVKVVDHSASGELLGTGLSNGKPVAFIHNLLREVPTLYPNAEPLALTPLGLGIAADLKSPGHFLLLDEFCGHPLDKLSGLGVTATRGGSSGVFVGSLQDGASPLPALFTQDGPTVLAKLEGAAVDVIASGTVLGQGKNAQGQLQPFLWTREKGLTWQPLPDGCADARAVALNEAGTLLANATCKDGQVPYLVTADGKPVRLDALAQPKGATFVEALALSDDNTVLVRAVDAAGADAFFLLQP